MMSDDSVKNGIIELLGHCKDDNFSILIWVGSAFSSAKEGKSGFICNLVKS